MHYIPFQNEISSVDDLLFVFLKKMMLDDLLQQATFHRQSSLQPDNLLDATAVSALEVLEPRGLLSVLDHCHTKMGSRLLRKWVLFPLRGLEEILVRQAAVRELIELQAEREVFMQLALVLQKVDLERVLSQVYKYACKKQSVWDSQKLHTNRKLT
jgi:DNA mismatch repair ATPase MutS